MTREKKILFTSHTANFAKYNQPFIQDLRADGKVVHYASAGEEKIEGVDREIVVDFARSPLRFDKHIKAYRQLVKLMEAEKYDLIHTHTPVGGVVTRMAARRIRRGQKRRGEKPTPVFYTAHGFHFYKGAPLVNWAVFYPVEKCLARETDVLITINHEDEDLAKRKFAAGRVERLDGVGVDLGRFRPFCQARADSSLAQAGSEKAKAETSLAQAGSEKAKADSGLAGAGSILAGAETEKAVLRAELGLTMEDFVVIYVAELNNNKDQEFLLRMLPELKIKVPCLKILFVGEGPRREKLEKMAEKLGVSGMVKFLGYRRDVEKLYRAADVVTSVSRREGLGLGIIEGMASGLPVVARDNRGHREIWQIAGNVGYLLTTEAKFVAAFAELARDKKRRLEIGAKNAKLAEKFNLERAREKMKRIYREILG